MTIHLNARGTWFDSIGRNAPGAFCLRFHLVQFVTGSYWCSNILGSGSHENGRPFKVVAMEKKVQTRVMHVGPVSRKLS
jgi:hypothetical protein